MQIIRTEALILKSIRYGETSSILQLLTPEGRFSVMAKGARRPKSRFNGVLQPLFHIEAVYRRKESRDVQMLTDAHVINPFRAFFEDFEKNVFATAVAESCLQLFHEGAPLGGEFEEIIAVMERIESGKCDPFTAYLSFLHMALTYSGFALSIERCSRCGGSGAAGDVRMDLENGTFLCGECLRSAVGKANMAEKRFRLLRSIAEKKGEEEKIDRDDAQKLLNFYLAYIRFHWKADLKIRALELL